MVKRPSESSLDLIYNRSGKPMFYKFTNNAYVGRIHIFPDEKGKSRMHKDIIRCINKQLTSKKGDADANINIKINNTYFSVTGSDSVPSRSLFIPDTDFQSLGLSEAPSFKSIFLIPTN